MKDAINVVSGLLKRNSSVILSSTAITGVVTTAYLTGRAAWNSQYKLRSYDNLDDAKLPTRQRLVRDARLVWTMYIPAAASGAVTIACIVGQTRISNKRIAAAQAAFVLSERAYAEYRSKVIEEYGDRRDQTIRDSIAEDRVRNDPPPSNVVLVSGPGNVLCCELYTGRYFTSDMETLRRAENDFNARLISQDSATLDDWYYAIGMQPTTNSGDLGWNSDKLLHLEFTPLLTEDNRPCIAFAYSPAPRPLFDGMNKGW